MESIHESLEKTGSNDEVIARVVKDQVANGGWARVPVEVILDRRVKGTALRVYALMAAALRYTGTVSIGMRLISEKTGIAVRNVARAIRELEDAGHVKVIAGERGMRGRYVLLAKVFHEKQGRENIARYASNGVDKILVSVSSSKKRPIILEPEED